MIFKFADYQNLGSNRFMKSWETPLNQEFNIPRKMKQFLKLMRKSKLWGSKNSNSKVERVREIQNNEFQQNVVFPLGKQNFLYFIKISEFCRLPIFWASSNKFVSDFWSQDFQVLVEGICRWFFRRFLLIILVEGLFSILLKILQ